MSKPSAANQSIEVVRISLDEKNPRHDELGSLEEAIEYLCRDEYILQLARDIANHGLSPLENFAVVPLKKGRKPNYVALEGNRRLCAIALLNDPDLAPPRLRAEFEKLASEWSPITHIQARVFDTREEAKVWIDRLHSGLQGGIGRKTWTSEQKSRFSGDRKNALAQSVLDYAESHGLISPTDRKGKLTTVQRFFTNELLRETIGLSLDADGNLLRTRPEEDIKALIGVFISDLIAETGPVNSRQNKPEIIAYARKLSGAKDISNDRVDPTKFASKGVPAEADDTPEEEGESSQKPNKPKKPAQRSKLDYDEDLHDLLKAIPSYKLESLYYSLCQTSLTNHVSLLAVGIWSFVETLTALCGRENTDFHSYLSNGQLSKLGIATNNKDARPIREALKRLSDAGNDTKHHRTSAAFNGNQIYNDFHTITPLLKALAKATK